MISVLKCLVVQVCDKMFVFFACLLLVGPRLAFSRIKLCKSHGRLDKLVWLLQLSTFQRVLNLRAEWVVRELESQSSFQITLAITSATVYKFSKKLPQMGMEVRVVGILM